MKQPFKFFSGQLYDGILLTALFFLSVRRILTCWHVVSLDYYCEYGNDFSDYILWGLVVLGALLLLIQHGRLYEYWLAWKKNWTLGLFILYAMASAAWSIVPERSIHTIYIMVAASLTGAVLAVNYSPKQLFKSFFCFTIICGIISLVLIITYPDIGIHQDRVWYGAWRGIFVHKNDLGTLMALANGLSLLSFAWSKSKQDMVINISSYLLSFFLIVMSRSATGLVLWVILNGLSFIYFIWVKRFSKLQGKNIIYIAGLSVAAALLGLLSLITVTSLLGKSLSLSGRVPMWINLLKYVVSQKPWFGFGLETLWYFSGFQRWLGAISGWGIAIVLNGHSGYMDILLYLGIVGLVLLCIILAHGLVHAMRRALIGCTWLDFFPLLIFVYFLIANVTSSYVLHIESFHWLALVTLLFLPPGKFTEQESVRNGL
jgi:exopolysaccharide production protein ExoQ